MTLHIDLPPAEESRLIAEARRVGVDPADLARKLLVEQLTSSPEARDEDPTVALLQSWLEEDATDDPEEIRRAQAELDEFKQAINAERQRAGARRIYP